MSVRFYAEGKIALIALELIHASIGCSQMTMGQ